jgi:hypothetical protein
MKLYNPLFIGSLEKHPSFSFHCYTNPVVHRAVERVRQFGPNIDLLYLSA